MVVLCFNSLRAKSEGAFQVEAEGCREEEQPSSEEKRRNRDDALQKTSSGTNG